MNKKQFLFLFIGTYCGECNFFTAIPGSVIFPQVCRSNEISAFRHVPDEKHLTLAEAASMLGLSSDDFLIEDEQLNYAVSSENIFERITIQLK